jgi:cell division protein FtsW
VLAYAGFRIARRSADRFVQLACVAITVWLIGQATMNMGYVVGLLPVTGVQLPLISAGGTSLVLTLFIVGLLARFARAEPEAIEAQRGRRRNPLVRLLLPVPAVAVDPVPRPGRHPARRAAGGGRTLLHARPEERRPAAPDRRAAAERRPVVAERRAAGPERRPVPVQRRRPRSDA